MPPAFHEKYLTFSDKFPAGLPTAGKFPAIFTGVRILPDIGRKRNVFLCRISRKQY